MGEVSHLCITHGKVGDVLILHKFILEPDAIHIMDRGYVDLTRPNRLTDWRAIFVTRARKNLEYRCLYCRPVDKSTWLMCDQIIVLTGRDSGNTYPAKLRRVRYQDLETGKDLTFLTNDFSFPALTIARLYQSRWGVELFFKWIKQHLKIKSFYGTSPNAAHTQLWIAICAYLIVAIARKRLGVERNLYTILQILSFHAFEKPPLPQVPSGPGHNPEIGDIRNQFSPFDS